MKPAHFIFPILALILGILCAPRDGGAPGKPLLETNPPGAAAERESRISRVLSALLEPDYLKQRHALFSSIETLRAADLGEMVARADSLPTRYRKEVLGVVVDRWFELDPVAAAAWVRPRTAEDEAWKVWARQFPKAVIEELHGTSSFEYDAVGILHEAVNALAGGDPADQLRLLSSLPADATRDRLIHQLLVEWVSRDASAAFFFAKDSATGAVAFETRQAIFELWVNRHPLEAAKE
ncbi:MAG: hypothetical protein V4710_06325, partial [Verrucomicrobiota bacterium]